MMMPIPTLNQTYAMLLQEENQRNTLCGVNSSPENLVMTVKTTFSIKSRNKSTFPKEKVILISAVSIVTCLVT